MSTGSSASDATTPTRRPSSSATAGSSSSRSVSRAPADSSSTVVPQTIPSPVMHPARPRLVGRASSYYSVLGAQEREDSSSPLFLGLDCSDQMLKVSVLNETLLVVKEETVVFDKELSDFGTKDGLIVENGQTVSPVLVWVAALDLLLDKLLVDDFPFERVVAISGAGQQHAPIYWSDKAESVLSDLDASYHLRGQIVPALATMTTSHWKDLSATLEAVTLESHVGGPESHAALTGARSFSRSTASQLLKVRTTTPSLLTATTRISLVSSFLCTLLCADGRIRDIDESDACGTRLWDVEGRQWDANLCDEVMGERGTLEALLGNVEKDGGKAVGTIGEWFVSRFGFHQDCVVTPFTGDSSAAFLAYAMAPNDIAVHLSESDTVLVTMPSFVTHPDVQLFVHPALAADAPPSYFGLASFKNGLSARSWAMQEYSAGSWSTFAEQLTSFSAPFTSATPTGFYYHQPELSPFGASGLHRFEDSHSVPEFSNPAWNPRALLESQFLAIKSLSRSLLDRNPIRRVYISGPEESSQPLITLLSNVLNAPIISPPALSRRTVEQLSKRSTVDSHSASIGSAFKAFWAYQRLENKRDGVVVSSSFLNTINSEQGERDEVFALLLAEPDEEGAKRYEERLEGWEELLKSVVEKCAEGA